MQRHKVYLKIVVSSSELEHSSSFPCSWHCSSKNHATSTAAPGYALSSEAAQTRWQPQNTRPKARWVWAGTNTQGEPRIKANGCKVSSGRAASRCQPKTSTGLQVQAWELLKQKGWPWKTTGTKHLGLLTGEQHKLFKAFLWHTTNRSCSDDTTFSSATQKCYKFNYCDHNEIKKFAESSYWFCFRAI